MAIFTAVADSSDLFSLGKGALTSRLLCLAAVSKGSGAHLGEYRLEQARSRHKRAESFRAWAVKKKAILLPKQCPPWKTEAQGFLSGNIYVCILCVWVYVCICIYVYIYENTTLGLVHSSARSVKEYISEHAPFKVIIQGEIAFWRMFSSENMEHRFGRLQWRSGMPQVWTTYIVQCFSWQ